MYEVPVLAHVSAGVHELLQFTEQSPVLVGQPLPRGVEARHRPVPQPGQDGEHRIEVLAFLTLACAKIYL